MNNQTIFPALTNMLDEVFGSETLDQVSNKSFWMPPANIKEEDHQFVIELSIPGFNKEDFEISLENQNLTISSKKEFVKEKTASNFTRREFAFKNFTRKFTLPKNVDTDKINANYTNGILSLTIPKAENSKITKKIEIK